MTMSWDDLPKQPWPEAVQPEPSQVADWLTSMTREQLEFVVGQRQLTWAQDSNCFIFNHEARIEELQHSVTRLDMENQRLRNRLAVST